MLYLKFQQNLKMMQLNYDRLKWRRKRGKVDSSVEILVKIKILKII